MISVYTNKIESEAIDNKEDISNPDFQRGILKVKEMILEKKGMTLDEYNSKKEEFKKEEDKPEEIKLEIV